MGHITVSLREEDEMKLRRLAQERYKSRKGAMAKVISEALEKLVKEKEQEEIRKRALARLEKGYNMGKILYKKREELYDRYDRK